MRTDAASTNLALVDRQCEVFIFGIQTPANIFAISCCREYRKTFKAESGKLPLPINPADKF
jgi:hypothetical protein